MELHHAQSPWVALDDDPLGYPADHFVQTDPSVGLCERDIERALAILAKPAP